MKEIKLFINGEFTPSSDGSTYITYDKASGETLAKVHLPAKSDLEKAIQSAEAAFHNSEWRNMTQEKRGEILLKIAEGIKERSKELVELEIADSGSTVRKAKGDIHNSSSFFKVMSKTATNFQFKEQDEKASREGFSKNYRVYEPVGVCAQIIPWNFPLLMAAWKIGPVIAAGCTTVLKTAQETPVTAAILGEIIAESGLPKGVVNIVTGGAEEGRFLTTHPKINKVAFTGSTAVGKEIMKGAATSLKKLSLELGGKSANIILKDADITTAVDGALFGFLYHSGQACTSGTRLLVDEAIYDQFTSKLLERIKEIKIGDPHDKGTGFGPVINEQQFNTIMGYINKTKEEGAKLLCGGERLNGGDFDKAYYIAPTIFEITPDHTIFHEEIFGPVAGITKFSSAEQAIELANNSIYGLAGAVWSKDHKHAAEVASRLQTGTVWINDYHLLNPGMPFGGYRQSGIGREMGREGMLAYLEVKHLWESDCDEREKKIWYDSLF